MEVLWLVGSVYGERQSPQVAFCLIFQMVNCSVYSMGYLWVFH